MKAVTLWKLSTLVLAGALAFTVGNDVYEAQAKGEPFRSPPGDPQPQMKDALTALQSAKGHLEKATHDKGGHRKAALKLTQDAIAEVKKGIEFDNKKSADGGEEEPALAE